MMMDPVNAVVVETRKAKDQAARVPRLRKPCVLMVDDDPFNFEFLQSAFEDTFEVLSARDGAAALDIALWRLPDIILLDVMMRGMNGHEVCRRLKAQQQTCDIPVIFISGLGGPSAENDGLEAGAVDYVTKPINPASIRVRVDNQLRIKQERDHFVQDLVLRLTPFSPTS